MRDEVQIGSAAVRPLNGIEPPGPATQEEREKIWPWGAGREWIPDGAAAQAHPGIVAAVRRQPPDAGDDASLARCLLLEEAGIMPLALATADSEGVEDLTDRAVSHQLAASHVLAMRFTGRAMRALDAAAGGNEAAERVAARAARVVSRMIGSHRSCYEMVERKRLVRWQRLSDEDRVRWLIAEGRTDTRAEEGT